MPDSSRSIEISARAPGLQSGRLERIAVVADNTWAAIQTARRWRSCGTHRTQAFQSLPHGARGRRQPGRLCRTEGDFAAALASADKKSRPVFARISRMRRWSRLRRVAELSTARPKSGQRAESPQARTMVGHKYLGLRPNVTTVNAGPLLESGVSAADRNPTSPVEAALVKDRQGSVKVVWTREGPDMQRHTARSRRNACRPDSTKTASSGRLAAQRRAGDPLVLFQGLARTTNCRSSRECGLVDMPFEIRILVWRTARPGAHKIG